MGLENKRIANYRLILQQGVELNIYPQAKGDPERLASRPFRVEVISAPESGDNIIARVIEENVSHLKNPRTTTRHENGDIVSLNKNTVARLAR